MFKHSQIIIFSFGSSGCVKLCVVEQVHPVDDVEDEKENCKHRDAVTLDLEQNFFVPIFSFDDSVLFLVFDVFGGRRSGGFDEGVIGRLVVHRRRVNAAADVDKRRCQGRHRKHLVLKLKKENVIL